MAIIDVISADRERQYVVRETDIKCVWIPGSSWRFLYRLLTPRDAPGRWKQQQTVCLQRTIACLASQAPVPPRELSTQSDPHKKSSYSMVSLKNMYLKIYTHQVVPTRLMKTDSVKLFLVQSHLVRNTHYSTFLWGFWLYLLLVHKMTRCQEQEGQFMLTFICQEGMKSALCRTLSKIFCSWGLMKELSEEIIMRNKGQRETFPQPRNPLRLRTSGHHFAVMLLLQCVPWILNICPILSAAPRTLHSVLTILSALASDRRGESNRALLSAKHTRKRTYTRAHTHTEGLLAVI